MARVTLVVNNFDEGSETFLHTFAAHLVGLGHEVTVHALLAGRSAMSTGESFAERSGIARSDALPALRSPRLAPMAARMFRSDAALLAATARRAIARFGPGVRATRAAAQAAPILVTRPDVVHLSFSGIGAELVDALELIEAPVKVAVSCRGSGELVAPQLDEALEPLLRTLFGRVDAVHAVADVVADAAVELGARPDALRVIRPAVDLDRFTRSVPPPVRGETLHVVTVARLHWIKGIDVQLGALATLRRRGRRVRWTVVGDGPDRRELEFRSRVLGIDSEVEFVGSLPPDEVRDLLMGAHVFVLSSLSEGTSNSVLEAMALEVPVISSAAGGMVEVLTDGVDSMVVPVGDAGSLADAVERMIDSQELAAKLVAGGRRTVSGGYTLDRQAAEWGAFYRDLLVSGGER